MDSLINQIGSQGRALSNHETRIQELEKSKAWVLGVSAACSGGIAILFNFLN